MTSSSESVTSRSWRVDRFLRSMGAYFLLPNLAFAIVGQFMYMTRPLVNVDYLLLGSVAGILPKRVSMLAYAFLLANDAFVSLSPVFHLGLETALFAATLALIAHLMFSGPGILFVASVVTLTVAGERISGDRERRIRPSLLVVTVLVLAIDMIGGTNAWFRADVSVLPVNLATSALYKTVAAISRDLAGDRASLEPTHPLSGAAATDGIRHALAGGARDESLGARHVVLILVESLGQSRDPGVDSAVLAPLLSQSIRTHYEIRTRRVRSHGATTSGELRELCNIDADYRNVGQVDGKTCLPSLLRDRGFATVAVHGYSRKFFARDLWYPRIGFERMLFADELTHQPGATLCGSTFRGVCDADASRVVRRELTEVPKGERRFVYWLTLSSHLPVDRAAAEGSPLDCNQLAVGRRFHNLCALMRMHRLVAEEVAAIAMDPSLAPTRFVLVGDHPPPFFSRDTRAEFAVDAVPFIELIPKQTNRR